MSMSDAMLYLLEQQQSAQQLEASNQIMAVLSVRFTTSFPLVPAWPAFKVTNLPDATWRATISSIVIPAPFTLGLIIVTATMDNPVPRDERAQLVTISMPLPGDPGFVGFAPIVPILVCGVPRKDNEMRFSIPATDPPPPPGTPPITADCTMTVWRPHNRSL